MQKELQRQGLRAERRKGRWFVWWLGEDVERIESKATWEAAYEAAMKRRGAT